MVSIVLRGFVDGYISKTSQTTKTETSFNPLEWPIGFKVPGGEALQNPAVAAGGGALLGALAEQLFGSKPPSSRTLIAALLAGGGLGGLSYGAERTLEGK
jgi:hypothetical protein